MAIYDVFEHDGRPWVITDQASSRSLEQLLRTRGPAMPVEAAQIGLRVLDVLEAADAAGVRHRDLTPAKVLVGDEQSPGSAAVVTGSPDFVAPERARGATADGLAADLWSLGATLYTAVEGRLPFHREGTLATLAAVVTDEPPPPRRAGDLRAVIDGLLIKDPAHRLGLADARRMLEAVVQGRPVVPVPRRTAATAFAPHGDAEAVSAPRGDAEAVSASQRDAAGAASASASQRDAAGAASASASLGGAEA